MVRLAMMPGIEQPEPMSIGINDLPERPNLRKMRSMMNATRAMYPTSSSSASMKKSTSICGTNPITAPTPPTMPPTISPLSQGATFTASNQAPRLPAIHSPKNVSLVKSVTIVPMVVTAT